MASLTYAGWGSVLLIGGMFLTASCGSEDVAADDTDMMVSGGDDDDASGDDTVADDDAVPDDGAMGDDDTDPMVTPGEAGQLADFETWDGATTPSEWSFQFGPVETPYTAGPYELDDETGEYTLTMVEGRDGSSYALSVSNTEASEWGGGVGFWMGNDLGNVDATAFTGISFWVRGETPAGTMGFAFSTFETSGPGDDGTAGGCMPTGDTDDECKGPSIEFPVSGEWAQRSFAFSELEAGFIGGGADAPPFTGANITGMSFTAHMNWVQDETGGWVPEPAPFTLEIDDIAFY